ncbi:unnamed protein product [Calypogeia fissa]
MLVVSPYMGQSRGRWSWNEAEKRFGTAGWWSRNLKGWNGFRVQVTADREETPFHSCVDDNELKMVDLLQHATHVDLTFDAFIYGWQMQAPMMPTSPNPPFWNICPLGKLKALFSTGMCSWTSYPSTSIDNTNIVGLRPKRWGLRNNWRSGRVWLSFSFEIIIILLFSRDLEWLAKVIESGRMLALEELNLGGTQMRDNGCQAYATAITAEELHSLTKIRFPSNGIARRGAQALARAIMQLREFEMLDLRDNNIKDEA